MQSIRRQVKLVNPGRSFGSTDMGNVSQVVPSIHAYVAIAPSEILLHSPDFATAAASEKGIEGMLDAARALAMTTTELLIHPELVSEIKELDQRN